MLLLAAATSLRFRDMSIGARSTTTSLDGTCRTTTMLRLVHLPLLLLATADVAALTTPRARPAAAKALSLRGGAVTKQEFALGLNAFVSAAYGVGFTLAPAQVLKIYGSTAPIDFLSPAHACAQFLGAVHVMIAYRCLSALGSVQALPPRDRKECLADQCVYHSAAAAVAAYRTVKGSGISLLAATATPLPGSLALAWLSAAAAAAA